MIAFFANLFGYVLNFLYGFIGNYGIAIILFSVSKNHEKKPKSKCRNEANTIQIQKWPRKNEPRGNGII